MTYRALYGGEVLYDPRDDQRQLYDQECALSMDEAGSYTFTMPRTHPLAGRIEVMARGREVVLERDGEEVFRGRVVGEDSDFYGCPTYSCEGERAYLNDVACPKHRTAGTDGEGEEVGGSVEALFRYYLSVYNRRCPEGQRIAEGVNQGAVVHPGEVSMSDGSRGSVWEAMKSNVVDAYGGYVRVRHEGGTRVADYLAAGEEVCGQAVEFGRNLLDYTRTRDGTGLVTRIVPVGRTVEVSHEDPVLDDDGNQETDSDGNPRTEKVVDVEAGLDVEIASLPDAGLTVGYCKSGDAVVCQVDEERYGMIEKVVEYPDISDPSQLVAAALADLRRIAVGDTIELTALDLSLLDASADSIGVGDYVHARSEPHGLDCYLVCREATLHPDAPDTDTYVLGVGRDTLTQAQLDRISELNQSIAAAEDRSAAATDRKVSEVRVVAASAEKKAESASKDAASAKEVADDAADEARGAKGTADKVREAMDPVREWAEEFRKTADTIVHETKLTDELEKFSREMSTTYASTASLDERLKDYSTTEQTSESIKSTVTSEYVKGLVKGEYATPDDVEKATDTLADAVDAKLTRYSTTEQTSEAIKSTVSAEYIEGKVGGTYATKTEVEQASDALTLEISAKVDAEGARQAVSAMVRATADGVECGQVDGDGKRTTPYSVMSSDGAFNVFDKSGGWLTRVDGKGGFAKRSRLAALYTPSDAGFTDEPTVQLMGGEYLWSSDPGRSSGSVKLTSVPTGGTGAGEYLFLEFIFTDGKRTFSERLYRPALNRSTALTRAVSDGSCVYLATMTLTLSASSGARLDTVTISNNKSTTLIPNQLTDQLYDAALSLTSVVGWG